MRPATPPPPHVRARRFVLLPFRNVTRRPEHEWLVTGGPLMLGQVLGQLRELEVVPEERLSAARRELGIADETTADAAQLRRIADETGGWTAVTGNVFAAGNRIRISAQSMDVATSRVLVRAETEIAADADPREAFDSLSVRLLTATGMPVTTKSLADVTTHSLDAFRAYARGTELSHRSAFREAEAAFTEALRLDSTFALAWASLAIAAINTGGVQAALDPRSPPYRAIGQAARLSSQLPDRDAQFVRAVHALFSGQMRRGRHLLDSLHTAHPDDLNLAFWVANLQLIVTPVDTSSRPPRLDMTPNRVVALAQMIVDRDPKRLAAHNIPVILYALGGGLWWGDVYGSRREAGSFAATMMTPPDVREVPVVRDSIEMVPRAVFDSLPADEQRRLRRRSADLAWMWVERWVIAGPEDAEAHLWMTRVAELREDYDRALRSLAMAESLGIQSRTDNTAGLRLSLLVMDQRHAAAAAIADSMLAAGTLTNSPFIRALDRRRAYGAAALLLSRRWDRVAVLAETIGPPSAGQPACASLRREMTGFIDAVMHQDVRQAIMDTVRANMAEVSANPMLAPCADALANELVP